MSSQAALLTSVLLFPGGLFALALGLGLKGADRRFAARLQARVGPPLLQPLYDLVKLGFKRTMVPLTATSQLVFLATPLVALVAMLYAAAMIPVPWLPPPSPQLGNVLVLVYLLAIPGVALMIAGSVSGSTYGAIGFSREMALMLAYEGPIVLVVAAVALRTGAAEGQFAVLSLTEIVRHQQIHGANLFDPMLWPALIAFLFFYPANLGIIPFDIPEAETEVLEGPLVEYSGPALGLFKLMSAVKSVVVLGLGLTLFFPLVPEGPLGLVVWLLEDFVLMLLGVTALRVGIGRMRIDQAVSFFLKWPLVAALASLAVVVAA